MASVAKSKLVVEPAKIEEPVSVITEAPAVEVVVEAPVAEVTPIVETPAPVVTVSAKKGPKGKKG